LHRALTMDVIVSAALMVWKQIPKIIPIIQLLKQLATP